MIDLALIGLFLGHVITSDGQLHDRELALLQIFLQQHELEGSIDSQLEHIFSNSEEAPAVDTILQQLAIANAATLEQAVIAGLAVAYSDGYFDPAEEALIRRLVGRSGFSSVRYTELKELAVIA